MANKTKTNLTKTPTKNIATKTVETSNSNNVLAFSKINYILLAIGMAIVILGFLLMSGGSSTPEAYNPDIFSVRRIKVAPVVCLCGFLFIIVAILFPKKNK